MRKAAVWHGDPTTTGGFVMAFSSTIHDDKKKVALSGDDATCGNCKGVFKIFGTGEGMSEKGRAVVVDGDRVLCPCMKNRVIVGSNPGIFITVPPGPSGKAEVKTCEAVAHRTICFDDRFVLKDSTGKPLVNLAYAIQRETGDVEYGKTDPDGHTHLLSSTALKENINVYLAG
jgi:uncharacterized Zn-binding protein involved in type VI secretion